MYGFRAAAHLARTEGKGMDPSRYGGYGQPSYNSRSLPSSSSYGAGIYTDRVPPPNAGLQAFPSFHPLGSGPSGLPPLPPLDYGLPPLRPLYGSTTGPSHLRSTSGARRSLLGPPPLASCPLPRSRIASITGNFQHPGGGAFPGGLQFDPLEIQRPSTANPLAGGSRLRLRSLSNNFQPPGAQRYAEMGQNLQPPMVQTAIPSGSLLRPSGNARQRPIVTQQLAHPTPAPRVQEVKITSKGTVGRKLHIKLDKSSVGYTSFPLDRSYSTYTANVQNNDADNMENGFKRHLQVQFERWIRSRGPNLGVYKLHVTDLGRVWISIEYALR